MGYPRVAALTHDCGSPSPRKMARPATDSAHASCFSRYVTRREAQLYLRLLGLARHITKKSSNEEADTGDSGPIVLRRGVEEGISFSGLEAVRTSIKEKQHLRRHSLTDESTGLGSGSYAYPTQAAV